VRHHRKVSSFGLLEEFFEDFGKGIIDEGAAIVYSVKHTVLDDLVSFFNEVFPER